MCACIYVFETAISDESTTNEWNANPERYPWHKLGRSKYRSADKKKFILRYIHVYFSIAF